MQVQPYLFFDGRCEEALEFYRKSLGASVNMLMRYKQCPEPSQGMKVDPEKIMHASFQVGQTTILATDGHCQGKAKFEGFSLSLTVSDVEQAEKYFAALADGGQVRMPLGKTFFSPKFGMLADKFGVGWMVYVAP